MIFNEPPMISGHPNLEWSSIHPAAIGGSAEAKLRGTLVTLAAAARSLARDLATGPTVAFAATKKLMQASFERDLDQAIAAEVDAQTMLLQTRDHAIGVAAFRAKERPSFEGR